MKCPYCDMVNKPERTICKFCGAPLDYIEEVEEWIEDDPEDFPEEAPNRFPEEAPHEVPDYLAYAILVTIFCCMPVGIVAIVYAARAKVFSNRGEYARALRESELAKASCWVGFITATILLFCFVLVPFCAGV
jgi:hypothetical protein